MTTPTLRKFQLHACPRCHGDLYLDDGDYTCLQCGSEFTPRRLLALLHPGMTNQAAEKQEVLAGTDNPWQHN